MPFTFRKSQTRRSVNLEEVKSIATEVRNQITEVAEELIRAIDIASLSNKDKVLYLKAIMPFILSKNERSGYPSNANRVSD